MDYDFYELLHKMGIPELSEKDSIRWNYMDASDPSIGGFADARMEADGHYLTVELRHLKKNYEDDNGRIHSQKIDSFTLKARRLGNSELFRISEIEFDGKDYDPNDTAMIELGMGIFYSRAIEINTLMIEQKLKSGTELKKPVENPAENLRSHFKQFMEAPAKATNDLASGVVVQFRPRQGAPIQRV